MIKKYLPAILMVALFIAPSVVFASTPSEPGGPAGIVFNEIQAVLTEKVIVLLGIFIALYGGWNFYKTKQKEELIYAAIGGTVAVTAVPLVDALEKFGTKLFATP